MRRLTSAIIFAVQFPLIFVPTLAHADCASDIEIVEKKIESGGGTKRTEGEIRAARRLVEKAKEALAEGKKEKCKNLVEKAQEKLPDG